MLKKLNWGFDVVAKKVSVITVCFNSEATIKGCIESVLRQSYKQVELVVVDGESKDATSTIVSEFSDSRIKFKSEPDHGIYDAMNKGIQRASGDIIAILNSDDEFAHENVLADVISLFEAGADIVYAGIEYIDRTGRILSTWIPAEYKGVGYRRGFHCPHPGFFSRKDMYLKLGAFDCSMPIAGDFDLMRRFMEAEGSNSVLLPEVVVKMRADGASSKLLNVYRGMLDIKRSFAKSGEEVSVFRLVLIRYLAKLPRALKTRFL